MDDRLLLGIDVGTSSTKGVLVTLDGTVVAERSVAHGFDMPQPGWAEQDADKVWWHDFCLISKGLIEQAGINPEQIAGVGCSAIAPTMLPLDEQGKPLRPSILYGIDTRTSTEIDELTLEFGEDEIFERTGQFLTTQSVGPKVLWFKKNEPELFKQTRKIVTATTYLVYKLTQRFVVDNYVAPFFTPFFNVNDMVWDRSFTEPICPVEWLPETLWTIESAGVVTSEAAEETGIPVGTPVSVGTADAATEAIAAGAMDPGDLMVMYASTMFLIQTTTEYHRHRDLWASVHMKPGQAILAAGTSTSGGLLRWFRDEFSRAELESESDTGVNAFQLLSQQAATVSAGSNNLVTLPYFSGERTPVNDARAKGMIFGLTLAHERPHVYRSLLEGIGYSVRHNIETMGEVNAFPKRLIAIGGGTQDDLWLQICSDIAGLPQDVPQQTSGAAYGAAYLGGYAAGIFTDTKVLRDQWVKIDRTIEPNPKVKPTYDRLYAIYRQLYQNTREQMHSLA